MLWRCARCGQTRSPRCGAAAGCCRCVPSKTWVGRGTPRHQTHQLNMRACVCVVHWGELNNRVHTRVGQQTAKEATGANNTAARAQHARLPSAHSIPLRPPWCATRGQNHPLRPRLSCWDSRTRSSGSGPVAASCSLPDRTLPLPPPLAHTHTHMNTHTCTRSHTKTRTHTHIHTHTPGLAGLGRRGAGDGHRGLLIGGRFSSLALRTCAVALEYFPPHQHRLGRQQLWGV